MTRGTGQQDPAQLRLSPLWLSVVFLNLTHTFRTYLFYLWSEYMLHLGFNDLLNNSLDTC